MAVSTSGQRCVGNNGGDVCGMGTLVRRLQHMNEHILDVSGAVKVNAFVLVAAPREVLATVTLTTPAAASGRLTTTFTSV